MSATPPCHELIHQSAAARLDQIEDMVETTVKIGVRNISPRGMQEQTQLGAFPPRMERAQVTQIAVVHCEDQTELIEIGPRHLTRAQV